MKNKHLYTILWFLSVCVMCFQPAQVPRLSHRWSPKPHLLMSSSRQRQSVVEPTSMPEPTLSPLLAPTTAPVEEGPCLTIGASLRRTSY
jgi:hypothetical protein